MDHATEPTTRPDPMAAEPGPGRAIRPKVSIVIPVYNGADFLAEAIDSALAQTYDHREVIVVNDGSTDDGATERVARAFEGRIRYVTKPNGGVATALNRGLEEMSGDYFSWLSHDDLYLPEKLAVQVEALAQQPDPRRCALYSDFATFTGDPLAAVPYVLPPVAPQDFRHFITSASGVHGCTLLVPRQAFDEHGRFDPALRTTQDYDLWFRMAATFDFVHQPRVLVRARRHPAQGTQALSPLVLEECDQLAAGFVARLAESEVRQDPAGPLAEGYFRLLCSFEARGYARASARALDLCRQSTACLTADELLWLLRRQAATSASLADAQAQILGLGAQCDDLTEQVRDLSRRLDDTLGSRSWRLTAPLRRVTDLLAGTTR